MNRSQRAAIGVAFVLSTMGMVLLVLALCHDKAFGSERFIAMGYANGKECCQGMCSVYTTPEDKIACCSSQCPQWVDDCVKECLFGGSGSSITSKEPMPRAEVYAALSRAGKVIRHAPEPNERTAAMYRFLGVMSRVEDTHYRLAAQKLMADLPN